jgi:arginine exporter protein ArgO
MDFIWFLAACLLLAFLWFLILALRVRTGKKSVTVEAIGAAMTVTKDDPDEPARWVP